MKDHRAISLAAALFSVLAITAALSACNGTPSSAPLPSAFSPALPATAFTVEKSAVPFPVRNPAWRMLGETFHVRFARALPATDDVRPGLTLALTYPASESAAVLHGRGVVIAIERPHQRSFPFVVPSRLDARTRTVTIEIPATLLSGATGLRVAIGVDRTSAGPTASPTPFALPTGPRYWNGKAWSDQGAVDPAKKTVVLIHGIFSSVESAFPAASPTANASPACPNQIAKAGGYDQVVGFDYDWTKPPLVQGRVFQKFLNSLGTAGLKSIDVEAHSYGTVVTLAALPGVNTLKIPNAVLLGGPLPMRGTPLANKSNSWRLGFVLGALDYASDYPPSVVDSMINSGMTGTLATNSQQMTTILTAVQAMPATPKFVQAAGTKWLCFYTVFGACVFSEESFKKVLIEGSGVTLPWDGVVETIAAESTDIPEPRATNEFAVSHVELECSDKVVNWVGQQVNP